MNTIPAMSDLNSGTKDITPRAPRSCDRCFERPRDLDGHEALHLCDDTTLVPESGTTLFRCAYCRVIWAREYAGGGQFLWSLAGGDD